MPREPPIVLPVSLPLLEHANPWALLLARDEGYSLSVATELGERYALKSDEKPFVKELLRRKRNMWVYRCDQRRFCGDFVVVDMSSPAPGRRRVVVLDLKLGAPLVLGGGGAGVQFANAQLAVEAIAARAGIIAPGALYTLASGDKAEVLAYLGARARKRPR